MADYCYAPRTGPNPDEYRNAINNFARNDYRYLINTFDKRFYESRDVIYTHSFYAEQFFELNLDKEVILITHNADTNIEIPPPDFVRMWFAQNVNIKHERVRSIPIGVENDIWFPEKKDKMMRKLSQKKVFRNLIYINHNIKTNPKERQKPYDVLKGQSWATVGIGSNGQGFDNYLDNVYNHPFVVCPEGNGIDTHRIWECLYVNTIPVVKRNINNSFYEDLPILFIDDWEELTDKFLHDSYMKMSEKKWNGDKLTFNYWKNEILAA